MGMLTRLFSRAEPIRVRKIRASRAVFESEEIQRIDIELILDGDIKVRLEMNPQLAHSFIQQLTNAYLACNPPLRGFNGNVGGYGM